MMTTVKAQEARTPVKSETNHSKTKLLNTLRRTRLRNVPNRREDSFGRRPAAFK